MAVDLHTAALEGFLPVPLEHLSAVPLLAEALRPAVRPDTVVVAPDLGAVKLAERYARAFDRPVAIVHKIRLTGRDVAVHGLVGDVGDRAPLVVDDMISTGGTIEAAVRAVLAAGAVPEVTVAASHGLFVGPAADRLRSLAVGRFLVTDSVALPGGLPFTLEVAGLAPLLAEALAALHGDQSLGHLLVSG